MATTDDDILAGEKMYSDSLSLVVTLDQIMIEGCNTSNFLPFLSLSQFALVEKVFRLPWF